MSLCQGGSSGCRGAGGERLSRGGPGPALAHASTYHDDAHTGEPTRAERVAPPRRDAAHRPERNLIRVMPAEGAVTTTILVLGGGGPAPTTPLPHVDAVIAADSGYGLASALGTPVDLLVGDLDSIDADDLAAAEEIGRAHV